MQSLACPGTISQCSLHIPWQTHRTPLLSWEEVEEGMEEPKLWDPHQPHLKLVVQRVPSMGIRNSFPLV